MPFSLTNALATFKRLMDRIFRKHCSFIGVFFDDIIVYSTMLEEHKEHLAKVFKELKEHKLYVNSKKSEFFLKEIKYLGHIISNVRAIPRGCKRLVHGRGDNSGALGSF